MDLVTSTNARSWASVCLHTTVNLVWQHCSYDTHSKKHYITINPPFTDIILLYNSDRCLVSSEGRYGYFHMETVGTGGPKIEHISTAVTAETVAKPTPPKWWERLSERLMGVHGEGVTRPIRITDLSSVESSRGTRLTIARRIPPIIKYSCSQPSFVSAN